MCASVYSLAVIAVERCRSITSPFSQRLNAGSCRKIITFIWMGAAAITAPWLYVFHEHSISGFVVRLSLSVQLG